MIGVRMETFRNCPGRAGYEVSNQGRVRSNRRTHPVVLKPQLDRSYPYVNIDKKHVSIHRLVLEAFVGSCPEGMEACHNDGNKLNYNLSNLRWGTKQENASDKIVHGTSPHGERNPNTILTKRQVIEIRDLYGPPRGRGVNQRTIGQKPTIVSLALKYGVSKSTISHIVNHQVWNPLLDTGD